MARQKRKIGAVRFREDLGKYFIDYYDNLGTRYREIIGENFEEADKQLNDRINQINKGTFDRAAHETTFKEYAEEWIKTKVDVKDGTLTSYQGILDNHLIPYFGKAKISEIKRKNIQHFVKKETDGDELSSKTIKNVLRVLHQILLEAQTDEAISSNPYLNIKTPRDEKKETDYLRLDEIPIFLENCEPKTYALFYTAIFSGMRRGELLGLKWGDIDWVNNQIHVKRTLYKKKMQSPKSKYSVRKIDMGSRLVKVLKEHRGKQNEIRLKAGTKWTDNGLIFCQDDGSFINGDNLYHRDFQRVLKSAGLRHMRIHDLRHGFASILIAAGHSPKYIQNQMGHGSIQITMDLYGHLMEEAHDGAANKTENFVFGHVMGTEQQKGVTAEAVTP